MSQCSHEGPSTTYKNARGDTHTTCDVCQVEIGSTVAGRQKRTESVYPSMADKMRAEFDAFEAVARALADLDDDQARRIVLAIGELRALDLPCYY